MKLEDLSQDNILDPKLEEARPEILNPDGSLRGRSGSD